MQRNIAIYGKGGIGKSTVSSHLAAFWGLNGLKVALIGCDPKRDTTLLLTGNRRIKPVLQALKNGENLQECFFRGYANVLCSEIGGPEPGVGCAGRGLLLAFEVIDRLGVLRDTEIVLYDVPGDVVCGGFVVPMKRDSEVYIVTSGEYLSIYACTSLHQPPRFPRPSGFPAGSQPRISALSLFYALYGRVEQWANRFEWHFRFKQLSFVVIKVYFVLIFHKSTPFFNSSRFLHYHGCTLV